jgi:hypothetical protein
MPGQATGLMEIAPPRPGGDAAAPPLPPRLVTRFCHDCRTPLAVIAEFASIVREDIGEGAPPDTLEFLAAISDRAFELEGLISDFTLVHRLGRVPPTPGGEACDVGALLAGLAADIRALAERAGRTLAMPVCANGIIVPMRRDDLGRAVTVLVEHMCRLPMVSGPIRLELEMPAGGRELRISIEGPAREGVASGGQWIDPPEESLSFRHHVAAAIMRHYGGRLEAREGAEQRCCRLVVPVLAGSADPKDR